MNANELADSLEAASSDMEYNFHVSDWKLLYECALVMRKQQAEIEALKNILSEIDRQVFNIELRDDGTMTPVIRMEKP